MNKLACQSVKPMMNITQFPEQGHKSNYIPQLKFAEQVQVYKTKQLNLKLTTIILKWAILKDSAVQTFKCVSINYCNRRTQTEVGHKFALTQIQTI